MKKTLKSRNKKIDTVTLYKFAYQCSEGYWTETKSFYLDINQFSDVHGFTPNTFKRLDYTAFRIKRSEMKPQKVYTTIYEDPEDYGGWEEAYDGSPEWYK